MYSTVPKIVELCNFGSHECLVPGLMHAVVFAVAIEVVAYTKLYSVKSKGSCKLVLSAALRIACS